MNYANLVQTKHHKPLISSEGMLAHLMPLSRQERTPSKQCILDVELKKGAILQT